MDIVVYNTNFEVIKYVDTYDSLIWNVKYDGYGDFELVVPYSSEFMEVLARNNYISIPSSDRLMIIEKVVPEFDDEKGMLAKFSGRSLESLLLRRIVWQQTTISGNLQNGIKSLITDAIISPSIADRVISNFIFQDSTDSRVTSVTIDEHQYTGDCLYDVIEELCILNNLGFKITLNNQHQFVFELYSGTNRTSDQVQNPIIEFSLNNDNLLSSNYTTDETNYRNVTLIGGEGEGLERKTAIYGEASGLNRREIFTDARDLQSSDGEETMTDQEYTNLLLARGAVTLLDHELITELDSEVDSSMNSMYVFEEDYFLGDVVDVVDFINTRFISRIIELTITINDSGYSIYPIFQNEEVT